MIFTFYIVVNELFLSWFSTRVSDDRKYFCGRRLYACIITRKSKGLDSREITSLPEIKNVMRTWSVISIIAENKPHAHHKDSFAYSESFQHATNKYQLRKENFSSITSPEYEDTLWESRFLCITFYQAPLPWMCQKEQKKFSRQFKK